MLVRYIYSDMAETQLWVLACTNQQTISLNTTALTDLSQIVTMGMLTPDKYVQLLVSFLKREMFGYVNAWYE